MKISELIASELASRGVKYVFGIPGGPSIPYMEEFRKNGIEFILTANETSAGVMAEVTGRLTGIPGVCHATFGPGATNLATGVGGALLDRSPVIALTTEVPLAMSRRTVQMNIDHHLLFEPLTKATIRMSPDSAGEIIADAFDLATSEYPGPVHIGLPSDIAEQEAGSVSAGYFTEEWDQETVIDSEAADLLEYARKPVLAIGLTAARSGLAVEVSRFLDQHPMPVLVTPMARTLVDNEHPCYAGVLFHALSDRLKPLIEEADLVIGLGYDPVEYNYEDWMPEVPIIHINTIKTDMPCDIMSKQVIGPLEGVMDMVSSVIRQPSEWSAEQIKSTRESITAVLGENEKVFGPLSLLKALSETAGKDSIVTLDVGSHIHLFGQLWPLKDEGKLLMSNGWSGMGFSIPAAIAAGLQFPGKRIIAITGDGGFVMTAGELITARRLNLPITVIVIADRELNLIKLKQLKRGLAPLNISIYEGDLFKSDCYLGIPVVRVPGSAELKEAMESSSAAGGPLIIEAVIDPSDYGNLVIV